MSGMDLVVADPVRGIVRAEGGALWEPAVVAAAAHGSAVLHGSSPDVGITGYSLGGGIGWFARKLGLATNSITAVELVTADGSLVRADAATNAELFWALRGGGGSFGVVTAVEFRMYPIESAYAGFLMWDIAEAEPVLREWAAWAPGRAGRGHHVVPGDADAGDARAARLPARPRDRDHRRRRARLRRARGASCWPGCARCGPRWTPSGASPAASLVRLHMDPEGGAPVASDSAMLGGFPDAAVDAFLAEVGPGATTPLLMAELRQLGGALARPHAGGGVLTHLDAEFVMFAGALAMDAESGAAGHAAAVRLSEALAPFANGRQYLNFAENPVDVASAYPERAWRQLSGIRSAVDPDGLFVANHPVPRLYEQGRSTT